MAWVRYHRDKNVSRKHCGKERKDWPPEPVHTYHLKRWQRGSSIFSSRPRRNAPLRSS